MFGDEYDVVLMVI